MSTNKLYENSNMKDLKNSLEHLERLWSHFDFVPLEMRFKYRYDLGPDKIYWIAKLDTIEQLVQIVGVDVVCDKYNSGAIWLHHPDLTKYDITKEDLEITFYIEAVANMTSVNLKDLGVSL